MRWRKCLTPTMQVAQLYSCIITGEVSTEAYFLVRELLRNDEAKIEDNSQAGTNFRSDLIDLLATADSSNNFGLVSGLLLSIESAASMSYFV